MRRRKKFTPDQIPVSKGHDEQYLPKLRHAAAVALTAAIISSSVVSGPALAQRNGVKPAPLPIIAAQAPEVTMGDMIKAGSIPYDETKMVADQSPALKKFVTSITSGALLPNVTLADQMVSGVGGNELGYSYGKEIADKLDKQNTPDAASPDEELAQAPDQNRGSGEGPGNLAGRDSGAPEDKVDPPADTPSLDGKPNELAQAPDTPTAGDTPSQPEESSTYDPSGEIAQMGIPGTSEPAPAPENPEPSQEPSQDTPPDSGTPSETPSNPSVETPETELAQGPDQGSQDTPFSPPQETPTEPASDTPETGPAYGPDVEPTPGYSDETPDEGNGENIPTEEPYLENGQGPPPWVGGPGGNPEAGPPSSDDEQLYSPDEGAEDVPEFETPAPEEDQGPPPWASGPGGNPDSGHDTDEEEQAEIDQPEIDSPTPDSTEDDKPENDKPENDKPENDKPENDKPEEDEQETETDSGEPQDENPQDEQTEDPQSGNPDVSQPGNGKPDKPIGANDDTEQTVDEYVETGDGDDESTPPVEDQGPTTGQNPQNNDPNNEPGITQTTQTPGSKPDKPIGASDDTEKTVDEYVETGDGDDAIESAENDVSQKAGNKTGPSSEATGPSSQKPSGKQPAEQSSQPPNDETSSGETLGRQETNQTSTPAPTEDRTNEPEPGNSGPQQRHTAKALEENETPAPKTDSGLEPSQRRNGQSAPGAQPGQQETSNDRDPQPNNSPNNKLAIKPDIVAGRNDATPQHKNTDSQPLMSGQSSVTQTAYVVQSDGSNSTVQKIDGDNSETVYDGPASYPEAIDIAMEAGAIPNVPVIDSDENIASDQNIEAPAANPATNIASAPDQAIDDPAAANELAQEITQDVETQVSDITEQASPEPVSETPIPVEEPEAIATQPYEEPVQVAGLQQDIQQTVDAQVSKITAEVSQEAVVPNVSEPVAEAAPVPAVEEQVYQEPEYDPATGYEAPATSDELSQQIDQTVTAQVADVTQEVAQEVPVPQTPSLVTEPAPEPYVEPVAEPAYEEPVQQVSQQDLPPATQVAPQDLPPAPQVTESAITPTPYPAVQDAAPVESAPVEAEPSFEPAPAAQSYPEPAPEPAAPSFDPAPAAVDQATPTSGDAGSNQVDTTQITQTTNEAGDGIGD